MSPRKIGKIVTKYLGPTDHKGPRVKATAQAGSVTVPWDDALDTDSNHCAAAKALATKWGWGNKWIGGADDRVCYVFVMLPESGYHFDAGE